MPVEKQDFEYAQREIRSHKLCRLLDGRAGGIKSENRLDWYAQMVVFWERFLDDPDCPATVRKVLSWEIGLRLGKMKEKPGYFEDFEQRRFLIERWQEICR